MSKKSIVIGGGFAGLSAASFLAKAGWHVTVIDKHSTPGGRARQLKEDGFVFDTGPGWYWMPDVFERYFQSFNKEVSSYYRLKRLDPSYRIYWPDSYSDIPAGLAPFSRMLEDMETGAAKKLCKFLKEAEFKYDIGIRKLVYKPGRSVAEYFDWQVISGVLKLDIFTSMQKHVRHYFRHPRIRQMLEFPVLFLGALPSDTPALYSLMNYADIIGGTWYPEGGMYSVVKGMHSLAVESGVTFKFNENVTTIGMDKGKAKTVHTESAVYDADVVIGTADYHFIEQSLLPASSRSYSERYWDKRQLAPSCLLYYVGLKKKLTDVSHHSLFFDTSFEAHADAIYRQPQWPTEPMFYVSIPSVTDDTVAPKGCENLVFLVPVAAGLTGDTEEVREMYFDRILRRFEERTSQKVRESIVYKKSFGCTDFSEAYHSFKGNAYGLANTLRQTAWLRPSCRSRKVANLFFAGQLTVPGPGVPPALISGEVAAREVLKYFSIK